MAVRTVMTVLRRSLALLLALLLLGIPRPLDVHAATGAVVYATKITVIYCIRAPCPGPWASLYTFNPAGSGTDVELGKIQTASGDTPLITSLAISPNNQLVGSDGRALYALATASPCCQATLIGYPGAGPIRSLAFTDDGRLFAASDAGLAQISPQTGAVVVSHPVQPSVQFSGGLTASPQYGRFYASTNPFGPPCGRVPEVCAAVIPPPDGLGRITLSASRGTSVVLAKSLGLTGIIGLYYNGPQLMGVSYRQQQDTGCGVYSALVTIDEKTGKISTVRCLSIAAATAAARPIPLALGKQTTLRLAHRQVVPGKHQTLTVRSVPDAKVRITVTEPGNLTRVGTGAVNARGVYRVSWHVSAHRGVVHVTVAARHGSASCTQRANFTIR